MENIKSVKIVVTGVFALISSWLGILVAPMYILVILNMMDYFTGFVAAPHRGEVRSSEVGFHGICKKICMWLLVALGGVLDWLVAYAVGTIGIELPFHFLVAALVAIWLICNEIISILENIGDIGVELPPFLMQMVRWVKEAAEDKAEIPEHGSGDGDDHG